MKWTAVEMATQMQPPPRAALLERRSRSSFLPSGWRRVAVAIGGAAAVLAVFYLALANVLLRSRLLRNAINGSPLHFAISGTSTALRLDYAGAYSILPGRVHIDGLTIRGRDRTVEWFLSLDRADVTISLVDLLHRSFHATRLRSSGFAIRARLRLDPFDATPEVVAALPPIAGFTDPPLLDVGPDPPPLTDANYNLWMVDLEEVDVEHVREVWIQTIRSEGDTRVRGRWLFRPGRWLDVGPATVDGNGVDLFYGRHPLVTGLRGPMGVTVHPFDLRQSKGPAIFDHVSATLQLTGRAIVASALQLLAPRSGIAFRRWEGALEARLVLDHGTLAEGTRVRTDAADCDIEAEGFAFQAPIRTEFGVDGNMATIDNRVAGLHVSRLGSDLARANSITATVTSRQLQLAHAFEDARFALDVNGAETEDIGQLLPPRATWSVRSATATASGHAEGSLAERRGQARFRLAARRLDLKRANDQWTADVATDAHFDDVSLGGGWAAGAATITAEDAAVRMGDAVFGGNLASHVDLRRGTWVDNTFEFSGGTVAIRAFSVRPARGGAAVVVAPSIVAFAPRFAIASSKMDGRVSIDIERADVVDLGRIRDLFPLPAGLAIEAGTARTRAHADVELGSGAMQGRGEVAAQGIRVNAGLTAIFGDLDGVLIATRAGDALGATDLSGSTVAVTHAGTGYGPPSADGWWGKMALQEATLRTNGSVRFDAKMHLEAKDATPATVLVSQNMDVPAWAANIFRMPVLEAEANVRVAPTVLEVRSFVARGGGTSLRGEYIKRDGRQDGGILMDLGWIGLGYDLAQGSSGLVLVGSETWFARKTAEMRNAAAAAERKSVATERLARYAAMTPDSRKSEAMLVAAPCGLDVRSCDASAIESLLRTAADASERDTLSGILYAPMATAAASAGKDGPTLDPLVIGTLTETLRRGGESILDHIPSVDRGLATRDSDKARGKLITVTGRASPARLDGLLSVGTLETDAVSVYFITPFARDRIPARLAHFRGVFVQRYEGPSPSLVLVGAFLP